MLQFQRPKITVRQKNSIVEKHIVLSIDALRKFIVQVLMTVIKRS